jgi:hypothetical protein
MQNAKMAKNAALQNAMNSDVIIVRSLASISQAFTDQWFVKRPFKRHGLR